MVFIEINILISLKILYDQLFHLYSIEQRMLAIQDKKKDLISGAFRQTAGEMRERRINDILSIFGL